MVPTAVNTTATTAILAALPKPAKSLPLRRCQAEMASMNTEPVKKALKSTCP